MGQLQVQHAQIQQVTAPKCDFCGEGHANGECVPEGVTEEAYYMGNCQKGNPYSNTYNPAWAQHSNLNYSNNNTLNPILPNPALQQQRKSSAFEEAMTSFVKMTQTNFQ